MPRLCPSFLAPYLTAGFAILAAILWGKPLEPAELEKLKGGGHLVFTEALPGKPWPRVTIYRTLPMEPFEAFAIFSDVEAQRQYVSGVVESRITKRVDERSFMVLFVQIMPWPLPREVFTTLNRMERSENAYILGWQLLTATSTRDASGYARFEPLGDRTLMTYQTWVDPGYDIARMPFLGRMAVKEVEEASKKIEAFIIKTRVEKPQVVAKLRAQCSKALGL